MDFVFSLESVFKPVHQCVIGTDGNKLIFANPAALAAFGDNLLEKTPDEVFPVELRENNASSFMCSSNICGKPARTFVSCSTDIKLYYIDLDPKAGNNRSVVLTRRMLSYLRNCASGIKIAADRCFSRGDSAPPPDGRLVSILYHYYYRLARTIIQIDSADKLERREMAFSPAQTDLVALCSELTSTLMSLNRGKEIDIRFTAESERLMACVDAALIEFMLLNLFSNSLKSTKAGEIIDFGVKVSQNKIVLSIDDNGNGIPQDKLSEIFSLPAEDQDSTRPDEGVGLGLYISHEIVRLHEGVMLVESRENEGVHIRILLPIGEEGASAFNSPGIQYRATGMSPVLTGLADVLSSDCYGPKFED